MTEVQEIQQHGRAMNVVQEFLVHKLLFPKVYLDTEFDGKKVDVLAIDRSGSGDVHEVRIFPLPPETNIGAVLMVFAAGLPAGGLSIDEMLALRSHYRYIAITSDDPKARQFNAALFDSQWALAKDGVGRIGVLFVDLTEDDPKYQLRVILRPERFRSSKEIVELTDQFVSEHTANWEYREEY